MSSSSEKEYPDIMEKIKKYKRIIGNRSLQIDLYEGWNIFDLPTNKELTDFLGTLSTSQIWDFERDVFTHGQDPKTYMKIHYMVESTAAIDLGEEIESKETVFHDKVNVMYMEGHDNPVTASTTSGFRDGYHPSRDNPDWAMMGKQVLGIPDDAEVEEEEVEQPQAVDEEPEEPEEPQSQPKESKNSHKKKKAKHHKRK
ncbi:hypothetical protein GCK72_020619 [Caenorhabditis remanei]|uniref:Uncharacterized protein n=1 Tax=Caenorhabditis remanei TaxID=31234 RepID=A0A6A5GHH2_CAERE|nr:hypothetical protein GCK72_020619 [Caenorhabditis remanei]KAF1754061.1 hypothetical protein GCK72_020619 [Caenorhabditis remanei]